MSAGKKSNNVSNSGGWALRTNVDAAKKWVAEETRSEAKEVFAQHTKETSNLDVLSRCKKLNELLSSDVLKGKGDPKAQLKEILGILHTGPKRPAFLDKPLVTAAVGKKCSASDGGPQQPVSSPPQVLPAPAAGEDVSTHRSPQRPNVTTLQRPSDDVEDIINLLNSPPPQSCGHVAPALWPPSTGRNGNIEEQTQHKARKVEEDAKRQKKEKEAQEAERQRKVREAQEEERQCKLREAQADAERQRKEREALEEAERRRKAKEALEEAERQRMAREALEEAERQRKAREAEEDAERQRKAREAEEEERRQAEELRMQRICDGAALCIQTQWRGYCARQQAAQRRRQLKEQHAAVEAACVLQAAWRARCLAREYRACIAAAGTLQCTIRAWCARQHVHRLKVYAFMRQRAARIIQRAFCAYRARGYTLAPLKLPPRPSSQSQGGVDGAALLAKQLRLRSAMDTRLAPERTSSGSIGMDDDTARTHRTVVTHMERVRQVSVTERNRRCEVSERAIMVASEHRDNVEALAIARQGLTSRVSSQSSSWVPATGELVSKVSGSCLGPDAAGHVITSNDGPAAFRPNSTTRRNQN